MAKGHPGGKEGCGEGPGSWMRNRGGREAGRGNQEDGGGGGLAAEISKAGFIVFINFPCRVLSRQHFTACWAGPQM